MSQEMKRFEDIILCERQNTTNEASLRKSAEVKNIKKINIQLFKLRNI